MEDEEKYQVRTCKIIDARHIEDTGTDDEPAYKQHVQLMLMDSDSGVTFIAPLSDKDLRELSGLDYELNSKEMIEISEWLRDYEGEVRLMVPSKTNKIDKDLLLNTPSLNSEKQESFRSAAVKRFKFNKEKIKES